MPDFEFVNLNRPGDEKRFSTKVRRHVMKDIGKARRKPKRLDKRSTTRAACSVRSDFESQDQHKRAAMSPQTDTSGMGERRWSTIRQVFEEARKAYEPLPLPQDTDRGLFLEAASYAAIANAIMSEIVRPGDSKPEFSTTTEAIEWYTSHLESLSRRLAEPEEMVHGGLIITFSGFAYLDYAIGDLAWQDIHLQCLKRLVDDKGGIDKITNQNLRFLISWLDLSGASYRNSAPYFKVPEGAITDTDAISIAESGSRPYFQKLLDSWSAFCPYLGDIRSALKATSAMACYINERKNCWHMLGKSESEGGFWSQDILAARLLAPALHKILSLEGRALPSDPSDPEFSGTAAREAFRRSLLIFLVSVQGKFGGTAFELGRHLRDFRQISQIPYVQWAFVPEFNLWAHTIVALHEKTDERDSHVSAIVGIMDTLGLSSGWQAMGVVKGIIWIEDLFLDEVEETLCREIDDFITSRAWNLRFSTEQNNCDAS